MEYFIMYLISVGLAMLTLLESNVRAVVRGEDSAITKYSFPWLVLTCLGWPVLLGYFIYLTYIYTEAKD